MSTFVTVSLQFIEWIPEGQEQLLLESWVSMTVNLIKRGKYEKATKEIN